MFTSSFVPATNKEGYARLTYINHEVKSGVLAEGREWSLFNINFLVKGKVRGTDRIISIATGFNYATENKLGITLRNLGYQEPVQDEIVDEEGFTVFEEIEDEEGFSTSEETSLNIIEFLNSIENNVYIAKLVKITEGKRKGLWVIQPETIKLFKVADKPSEETKPASNGKGKGKNKETANG